MMIFKKSISRRAVLRGVGASLALPMLDAMVPAFAEAAPSLTPTRIGFVYFPNGAIPSKWKPTTVGSNFELTQILKPMAPFKDSMMVMSGLDNLQAKGI
jgi:hypothetical protein